MLLQSLEIKNYRSLENVKLDNLQQFNVLIGRNNAGKSSVLGALNYLSDVLANRGISGDIITAKDATRSLEITLLFKPHPDEREQFVDALIASGFPADRRAAVLHSPLLRKVQFAFKAPGYNIGLLHLRETKIFTEDSQWAVIEKMVGDERTGNPQHKFTMIGHASTRAPGSVNAVLLDIDKGQNNNTVQLTPQSVVSAWSTDPATSWLFDRLGKYFSNAYFFNPFRHSTADATTQGNLTLSQDGSNLAQVLHTINSNDRRQFEAIEGFIHAALPEIGQLQTPIPIGGTNTGVAFKSAEGYDVRLHEMGGGIEQLLMVATVLLTTTADHPLFLEEPESHLHAGAQRFLLEKLYDGERQVFITTHSPVFINLARPFSIYRVNYAKGRTQIKSCDAASLDVVLEDIGVRNSDVLLSDAVLFVEGPGDKEVFSIFSDKLEMSFAERNINVLPMGGGKYAERGAPVRSDLLKDISQKAAIRHMFVLDRDERRQEEVRSLEERLKEKVHFFSARELENYLLVPRAIVEALRSKQRDSSLNTENTDTVTEEQISQLIQNAADKLYNTVLIKRIRTEIGGLRDGLLPPRVLSSLIANAGESNLADVILRTIISQWDEFLAGLDIDAIVSAVRERLDARWNVPQDRLQLAPGEEILAEVFQAFGLTYAKPVDTVRIAREMRPEEIHPEIVDVIIKALALSPIS